MEELADASGAAITVRGTYFGPGKKPKEGERKLHLFIEGKTEAAVAKAKVEITKILRQELHREATTYTPAQQRQPGRYKVLAITGGR